MCLFLKSANCFVHTILFWMIFLRTHLLLTWTGTAVLPLGPSGGRSWDTSEASDWSELIWISVFPARRTQTCRSSALPRIRPSDLRRRLQKGGARLTLLPPHSQSWRRSVCEYVCVSAAPVSRPAKSRNRVDGQRAVMFTWKWRLVKSVEEVEVPVRADGDELAPHSFDKHSLGQLRAAPRTNLSSRSVHQSRSSAEPRGDGALSENGKSTEPTDHQPALVEHPRQVCNWLGHIEMWAPNIKTFSYSDDIFFFFVKWFIRQMFNRHFSCFGFEGESFYVAFTLPCSNHLLSFFLHPLFLWPFFTSGRNEWLTFGKKQDINYT